MLDVEASLITTPMCAFGGIAQKYIMLAATPGAARALSVTNGLRCTHSHHDTLAYGAYGNAKKYSEYTQPFCALLALALLRGEPVADVPIKGDSPLIVPGSVAAIVLGSRVGAMTIPGYVEPPNPGFWNEDDRDESDNEEDMHETNINGMAISYKASIKTKIKFTVCDSGETRRHVVPNNLRSNGS